MSKNVCFQSREIRPYFKLHQTSFLKGIKVRKRYCRILSVHAQNKALIKSIGCI